MKMGLIAEVAWSLLTARWRQTLVAAIGVTFSITMFIALLSFMEGLNSLLDGLIINRTPHVRLYHDISPNEQQPVLLSPAFRGRYHFLRSVKPRNTPLEIRNYQRIVQALESDERVMGYAPKITAQVFYNVGSVDIGGLVDGVDVEAEARLFLFSDYVTSGDFMSLKSIPNSIILGKGVAQKMMAGLGDVIQVTSSKGEQVKLKVVGYFQSGLLEIDQVQSYVSIPTAQRLNGVAGNEVTDIQIKLHDISQAPRVAAEFSDIFELKALDIQTANAQFETGSNVRSLISYAVGITLLVVAGFGIYNILNMMIYEKMDSIAILKATGFSGHDVNLIFILVALAIGISGGTVGLLGGWGLSYVIDQIPFNTAALPTIKTYPVSYSVTFYLIGIVFSLVTTYLAGFFPARKASRVDPVVIIRGK